MPADLHLDPDGVRRAAVAARGIADGLERADPGPPGTGPSGPGRHVDQLRERVRESVRRARDELACLASEAAAAAARVEETDRDAAASLRAVSDRGVPGTGSSPGPDGPR